jgi:serine/threonine protein kinase
MSYTEGQHPLALAYQAYTANQLRPEVGDNVIRWSQKLDEGGAGELWLGFWPRFGVNVVGKYLREKADPTARRGFAREIRILQRNFRGFVRLFAADSTAAAPYYIMEYFAGGSLVRWAGSLNRLQLGQIALDASTYLAALHAWGIAHGDLKPQNFLLGNDGRVRIADPIGCGWGCTQLFAENRGGTPGYWAPEILRGHSISPSADVWSLGASMYHLATGARPVDGTQFDFRYPICHTAPEIAEVVRACCQSNPDIRPSMNDIPLLLKGHAWATIRAGRQRALNSVLGLGGTALLLSAITSR